MFSVRRCGVSLRLAESPDCAVLADAAREDKPVNPFQTGRQPEQRTRQPVAEKINRETGPIVPGVDCLENRSHVIAHPGDPEKTAFSGQNIGDLF
jgi:hypothetical protein